MRLHTQQNHPQLVSNIYIGTPMVILHFKSLTPGKSGCHLKNAIFNLVLLYGTLKSHDNVLDECHRNLLLIRQYWFRYWLGAVRQQAITWIKVDPYLCHHMVLLGSNELNICQGISRFHILAKEFKLVWSLILFDLTKKTNAYANSKWLQISNINRKRHFVQLHTDLNITFIILFYKHM